MGQAKIKDFEVFTQPIFLVALLMLLVNDLYLKTHYASWLTGKLSDFAGLYVFAQFVAVLLGFNIYRVAIATSVLFIVWKSPLATPFIEFTNQYSPIQIRRTIDYTDLVALLILPFAIRYYALRTTWRWGFLKYPIAVITFFSIMATSTFTGVPGFGLRFDLQATPGRDTIALPALYAEVEKLLAEQGLHCVICTADSTYHEYVDAEKSVIARFNYDVVWKRLFISLHTYAPDVKTNKIHDLQALLMERLRPKFQNITVIRSGAATQADVHSNATWNIKIKTSSTMYPFTCRGAGIRHPDIAKAMAILDGAVGLYDAVEQNWENCHSDKRCTMGLCRNSIFGQVIGPKRTDRVIHLSARGDTGWGSTTLNIDVATYGEGQIEGANFARDLVKQLEASLSPETTVTLFSPNTKTCNEISGKSAVSD